MTRYFVDRDGKYLGGYDVKEGALARLLPEGAVEVEAPPPHGACTWDGSAWSSPPPAPVLLDFAAALERLEPEEFAILAQLEAANPKFKWWMLRAAAQGTVNVASREFAEAKEAIVAAGLFTRKRFEELFRP